MITKPKEWHLSNKTGVYSGTRQVCYVPIAAEASFIVRACNSHEETLRALKEIYAKFTPAYNTASIPKKWGDSCLDILEKAIAKAEAN